MMAINRFYKTTVFHKVPIHQYPLPPTVGVFDLSSPRPPSPPLWKFSSVELRTSVPLKPLPVEASLPFIIFNDLPCRLFTAPYFLVFFSQLLNTGKESQDNWTPAQNGGCKVVEVGSEKNRIVFFP